VPLLYGFDVNQDANGTLRVAWAAWPPTDGLEVIQERSLTPKGVTAVRASSPNFNQTYPRYIQTDDGTSTLYASGQTPDYQELNVVDCSVQTCETSHTLAVDFMNEDPALGAPNALIWEERRNDVLRVHTGAAAIDLGIWDDRSAGWSIGVHGSFAAVSYDGGVYAMQHRDGEWWAAMLQTPEPAEDWSTRLGSRAVELQRSGDELIVSWWHQKRGLLVWRGPEGALQSRWRPMVWSANAGMGLGLGAKTDLGQRLMTRAEQVMQDDPQRAQCLQDIVAVGLRNYGGPGYRENGSPEKVPSHCYLHGQ
jgi:hypothetical protein